MSVCRIKKSFVSQFTFTHSVQQFLIHPFLTISMTLSTEDRCRHFMIDALEDGHYIIVGENRRHRFLQDLVDFHRRTPIMPFSEVLTVACGQVRKCFITLLFAIFCFFISAFAWHAFRIITESPLQSKTRTFAYLLATSAPCKKSTITNCFVFSLSMSDPT